MIQNCYSIILQKTDNSDKDTSELNFKKRKSTRNQQSYAFSFLFSSEYNHKQFSSYIRNEINLEH